ncbi:MAG: hypothetical protein ABW196_08720 [Solirubrobacterales bacterium]
MEQGDTPTPTERKTQIARELQALDTEHAGRALPDDVAARWRELERELEAVEDRISAEVMQ